MEMSKNILKNLTIKNRVVGLTLHNFKMLYVGKISKNDTRSRIDFGILMAALGC